MCKKKPRALCQARTRLPHWRGWERGMLAQATPDTERPVTLDRGLWALDRPPVSGDTANTRTARYAVSWIRTIT